jgi:hypothetical protein
MIPGRYFGWMAVSSQARSRLTPMVEFLLHLAQVAELADALDSGSSGRKVVEVRVLSWAPFVFCEILGDVQANNRTPEVIPPCPIFTS